MADRERRIAILRQGLRAKPGESAEWVRLANELIDVGRPVEVLDVFREVTDALPKRPQLHYDVISGLCECGPHLLLLKGIFERAAAQPAAQGSCFYGLGLIRQIDADPKGALACFTQALRRDPTWAAIHHNMAVVFLAQDRPSDAIAAAEAAVRASPDMAEPYFVIGSIHMAEGRLPQALEYLQKFVLLARTPDLEASAQQAYMSLALMRERSGAGGELREEDDFPPTRRRWPSYESICASFRENLSRLSSPAAYTTIHDAATELLQSDSVDSAQPVGPGGSARRRAGPAFDMLVSAFDAYRGGHLVEARRLAAAILETDWHVDPWSSVDAEHIVARTQFDEQNLAEAEATLLRVLSRSEQLGYSDGFVRALHEISRVRVKARNYEAIDAEAGFRVALEYYSLRALASSRSGDLGPAHDSDLSDIQSSLGCLSALAETYVILSSGNIEGSRLLQALRSDCFADDQAGDDFLEIRGLALRLLTKQACEYHAANLLGRAVALLARHRPLSMHAFDEAAWHGERRGIAYPSVLRQICSRSAGPPLHDSSSFKPNARVDPTQRPLRHTSPDDAAESIGALYDYLTPLDREGRYVYRGQVQDYDVPLLPSAFRGILTESHGAAVVPWSSFLSTSRLRDSGESFLGDYNYCFRNYADVTGAGGSHRGDQAAQDRIAGIYHKLLNDLSLILAQQRESFVSWADAVRSVLPESDLEVYRANAAAWNVRIDNYHKRTFRDEMLVRLFGYTLGTTFAQQFGLSSEGLDATKSLSVACFFATHHSSDFFTMADAGVGVIYRFPFPVNDVAARPLSAFNYYNLPSIVDVEDVFYRFENEELSLADGIGCMLGYLTAALTYHVELPDILVLPRGFMASSRVQRQQAVIVLPDEIREDLTDRDPGIGGIRFPKYRYIEDLKARPGVQRFYFRHTGRWPDSVPRVTREHLWPRDDFLLKTLILLTAASYRIHQAIPKRLDLIDGGYAPEEFLSYLKTLFDQYHFSFVTPQEGLAPFALVG